MSVLGENNLLSASNKGLFFFFFFFLHMTNIHVLYLVSLCDRIVNINIPVLALTVKIRKSQDFLAPISGSPGDQIFSLTFKNSTSVFVNSHLWSKSHC